MPGRVHTEADVQAALEAISDPARFRAAENAVAKAAPSLQGILAQAIEAGGWFGEAHESGVLKAATNPDTDARLTAVRTMLAEEARMGMMVGVAVGWALAEELNDTAAEKPNDKEE